MSMFHPTDEERSCKHQWVAAMHGAKKCTKCGLDADWTTEEHMFYLGICGALIEEYGDKCMVYFETAGRPQMEFFRDEEGDWSDLSGEYEPPTRFQVVVGNIGTVYDGYDANKAEREFTDYVRLSEHDTGSRAYGESVALFEDGEGVTEYTGKAESRDRNVWPDD